MELTTHHIIPKHARSLFQIGGLIPSSQRGLHHRTSTPDGTGWKVAKQAPDSLHEPVDCIVLAETELDFDALQKQLGPLLAMLDRDGQISMLCSKNAIDKMPLADLDLLLEMFDLLRYHTGALRKQIGNGAFSGIVMVRTDYNPVRHARQRARAGLFDEAIEILRAIPLNLVSNNQTLAELAQEQQRYFLNWQKQYTGKAPCYKLFGPERKQFAQVTALTPHVHATYHLHAEFWNHIGRHDMAARLLKSLQHAVPNTETKLLVHHYENMAPPAIPPTNDNLPFWPLSGRIPRILVLTHDYSDYGMDTLYHGLCTLLGKDNVIEFPWKPTLHNQAVASAENYPCVFDFPGTPSSVQSLVKELEQGKFDLILYADVVQMAHGDEVRQIMQAAANLPVVLYDSWDECYTPFKVVLDYLGRERFDVVFKRELLAGVHHEYDPHPLPFGYPQVPAPEFNLLHRSEPIFWAGKKDYGLRPLYIERLEKRLGRNLDRSLSQEEYRQALRKSRIGLSFFGCGFDTVRYWEVPANRAMLMSERVPIRIPYNFEDGVSAVFFDDLADMDDKLDYYLNHPDIIERIAESGYQHYKKYHTSTARAQQLLGVVFNTLNWDSKTENTERHQIPTSTPDRAAQKLYFGVYGYKNSGWGICSQHFIKELSKVVDLHVLNKEDDTACHANLDGVFFQGLNSADFLPLFRRPRGLQNVGYTFFEQELTLKSKENAGRFNLVLAGSTWCRNRMRENGIDNCDVLLQGIDSEVFYPAREEKLGDRFVIFSGGKFELRKSQDIVLRAVKILQDRHPDVWFVNSWYNMWEPSIRMMESSQHIKFKYNPSQSWKENMLRTYLQNGLDPERIVTCDLVPYEQQRQLYAQTDLGIFPNRCEGGTNLVMMEYMACGKLVIASNTSGHKDILTSENALCLNALRDLNIVDPAGKIICRWQEPSLDELLAQFEYAYENRAAIDAIGQKAGETLKQFTWEKSARSLLNFINALQ